MGGGRWQAVSPIRPVAAALLLAQLLAAWVEASVAGQARDSLQLQGRLADTKIHTGYQPGMISTKESVVAEQLLRAMVAASASPDSSDNLDTSTASGVIASTAPPGLDSVDVASLASRLVAAAVAGYQTSVINADSNKGLRPTRLLAFERTHYYQIPSRPRGTVLALPGCARAARGHWPYDREHCRECLGLPQELSLTKQALRRGYAVLALSPKDQKHLCWSSSGTPRLNDQSQVLSILADFLLDQRLQSKPVYVCGVSSGATFALKQPRALYDFRQSRKNRCPPRPPSPPPTRPPPSPLPPRPARNTIMPPPGALKPLPPHPRPSPPPSPTPCHDRWDDWELPPYYKLDVVKLKGIFSVVSSPEPDNWGIFREDSRTLRLPRGTYPPTLFIAMGNDPWGISQAPKSVGLLRMNGVPSSYVVSPPRRILITTLAQRIPVITPAQSAAIVGALQAVGLLDSSGWVVQDPKGWEDRQSPVFRWTHKVYSLLPWLSATSPTLSLQLRTSSILQELLVAYAQHESIHDYFTACLMWLESGGNANFLQLAAKHKQTWLSLLDGTRQYDPPSPPPKPPPPRPRPGPAPRGLLPSPPSSSETRQPPARRPPPRPKPPQSKPPRPRPPVLKPRPTSPRRIPLKRRPRLPPAKAAGTLRTASAEEGGTAVARCPIAGHVITSIVKPIFGNPAQRCNFTASYSTVAVQCLHRSGCSVPAMTDKFGVNRCKRIAKSLSFQYSCGVRRGSKP